MLRSIKRAYTLEPNNPDLHCCLVRFLRHTSESTLSNIVSEVVKRQSADIFSNNAASALNTEFLAKNSKSLPHLLQGARMLYLLDPKSQLRAIDLVCKLDNLKAVNLQNCTKVLEALQKGDFGLCEDAIHEFSTKCHQLFPFATAFRPSEKQQHSQTQITQPLLVNHQEKEASLN